MKQFMSFENVLGKIKTLGGGEFHSLTFVSKPQMKKGMPIINKVNKVSIRTKLDYENTKRYADYVAEHPYMATREEDSTYVVDKAIKHNNKTNNDLFVIIPRYDTWESHYETENGDLVSKEEFEKMACKKTKKGEPPYVMTVNARQILELN